MFVDVDNTKLYYEDEGAGPVLLLLHGWATSGRVWGAQLPEFVATHRVVTLDWRGCGRSDRPAHGNTLDGVLADLVAVIERLDLDRPTVVGSSIGGSFATELAVCHPELISAAVSVDGPAFWPSTGMPLAQLRSDLRDDRAGTFAGWVPRWFAPGVEPALVDWTVRQMLDSGVYIDEHFDGCLTYDPRPVLPGLMAPIHYIHGELDTEIPVAVAEECAALTPGASVAVIPGAGHMPHQENPAAFNAALRKFLS
ncbi:alpha/beta fold hydrolase [Kutzneria sp. 744]|uniref:alpha/beta fold hydrolase n=1 Tax=Kutzneria sp. (strain 744) TaxID=345341 RepID=UPI0004BBEB51|nr:alpha/beta hydrolase [Kutzneria sp. 744]